VRGDIMENEECGERNSGKLRSGSGKAESGKWKAESGKRKAEKWDVENAKAEKAKTKRNL
jgi:hypothetical protein